MRITDQIKDLINLNKIKKSISQGFTDIELIQQLTSDKAKMQCLDMVETDWQKMDIVKTLTTDEAKEKCLDMFEDMPSKRDIIQSMTSDKKKEEHLEEITGDFDRVSIIKSIKSDELKKSLLDKIDDIFKGSIIQSMTTDEAKKNCLEILDDISRSQVIESMTSDEIKKQCLEMVKSESSKRQIVNGMATDDAKKSCLNMLTEVSRFQVITGMETDEIKEQCLEMINSEYSKAMIISGMANDEMKEVHLAEINNVGDKTIIIKSMKTDEIKERHLDEFSIEPYKCDIVCSMTNDSMKERCLDEFSDEANKLEVVTTMIDDSTKRKHLNEFDYEEFKIKIIDSMKLDSSKVESAISLNNAFDQEKALQTLNYENALEQYKGMDSKLQKIYRNHFTVEQTKIIRENLYVFINSEAENIDIEQAQKMLEEMEKTNEEVLININFNILKSPYIETLGIDKINTISYFDDIQEKILNMEQENYNVFTSCLDHYIEQEGTERWTDMCSLILSNIDEYSDLINDLQGKDYDIDKLYQLLQTPNTFEIDSFEKLENCDEIIRQKCDEYISSDDIEKKREAVLQKAFGQSSKEVESIIEQYGEDIDTIGNEDLKDYIKSIKTIMAEKPETLDKIYKNLEEKEPIHKLVVERALKKEFYRPYNQELLQIDSESEKGNIITIPNQAQGSEFKIILTSVGAFVRTGEKSNAKENWNRRSLASPHFCASYIRNDMMGTAPIKSFCYGFNNMDEDSLALAGAKDVYSNGRGFTSQGSDIKYYSPDNQINQTMDYNEMDFYRTQNGERKQPDYIIVFKKDGETQNMDQAQQASEDWGGMPIVVIDVDEVLRQERAKAEVLQMNYTANPTPENARELYYKIKNNQITAERHITNFDKIFEETNFREAKFCENVNLEQLKQQMEDQTQSHSNERSSQQHTTQQQETILHQDGEVQLSDYETAFENVSAMERKTEMSRIHRIAEKIKEVQQDFEER